MAMNHTNNPSVQPTARNSAFAAPYHARLPCCSCTLPPPRCPLSTRPSSSKPTSSSYPLRRPRASLSSDPPRPPTSSSSSSSSSAAPSSPPIPEPDPASPPTASLTRQILSLALPALGALALDPLLSLIDTAFVGRLGVSALGGVGISTLLLNISFSLFNFLCVSMPPLVAAALHDSPDDRSAASQVVCASMALGLVLGCVTGLTLFATAPRLLTLLGGSAGSLPHAVAYLRVRCVTLPLALMTFALNGALRGLRDLRTPLRVAVWSNALNVLLDALLIFQFGLGVAGAAAATCAAQALAFTLLFRSLLRSRRVRAVHVWEAIRNPPLRRLSTLAKAGTLLAMRTLALLGTVGYATRSAARLGDASMAAFELTRQLWVFHATVLDAVATAAQALVASAVVANQIPVARAVAWRSVTLSVALSCTTILVAPTLPQLFTSSPEVAKLAALCVRVAAIAAPINGAVFAMDGVLAACQDYRYLVTGISAAAAVSCAAIAAVNATGGGVAALWAALNVLMIARAAVVFARFFARHGPLAVREGTPRPRPKQA